MGRIRKISQAFDSMLSAEQWRRGASSRWCPAADVYRTRKGWLVKLELAGVAKEDVQVSVRGRLLAIRGRRRDTQLGESEQQFSLEISYSDFERRIELPCELEHAQVSLDSHEGMLLVRIDAECRDE